MKALQATDFKWPYVCSVCLGCPASDTRDLGEKKKRRQRRDRGDAAGRCSLARAPLGSSLLARSLLAGARAPGFKSSYWLVGECARMWPMLGPVVASALRQRRVSPIGGAWRLCIYGVWRGATRPSS